VQSRKVRKTQRDCSSAVRKHFKDWVLRHKTRIYFTWRVIFYLKGHYKDFDFIIVVTLESRISRVLERDNTSRDQIIAE
jgi:dephospho-CoA kinase